MTDNIVEQIVGVWKPLKVNGEPLKAYEVLPGKEVRLASSGRIIGYKEDGTPWPHVILKVDGRRCRISRKDLSEDTAFVYTETGNCLQKLMKDQVVSIKKMLRRGDSTVAIASKFGVDRRTISDIKHDQSWAYIRVEEEV